MGSGIIAVVDDNVVGLRAMTFLLETAGYNAVAYASAALFLADTAAQTSVLIVDQNMPDMTGLQLVALLRERVPHIPVLLTCGFLADNVIARASELRIEKVLEKPVEPEELLALVASYV